VSETALKGERHHNIVAIAGMNRHKDIPLDTALNQCLDYNKNHCSPSKAEYLVRNAVTDVYRRYEPGRAPKSVREEFFLTTSDLTRGARHLLKVAKKSTDNGKKVFKFLYDEIGLSDDCPRKYTPRDVLNLLVEKLAYWCNGDLSYDEKYDHYYGQNLLAQSLHEQAYTHDPGFRRFVDETGLPFRAQSEFKKADLDARQDLYRALAEQIWNPENLLREVDR